MHVWGSLGHLVRAPAARSGGVARVPQDGPESPNVHFSGPAVSNTTNSSTSRPQGGEKKEAIIWAGAGK